MKPPEIIETERLILRQPRMDDAAAIFVGWTQDPEVTRYLVWRPHQRLEQTEAFLSSCISAWQGEVRFPFMITLKETGEVTGMIDPRIEGHKMMIGYGAARAHWGKGYMTEALCAIIKWAFQQSGIYRVYATTDIENIGSRRVMEKAGMQCEGILRKYMVHPNISDVPRDCYMYAIVK
jgi:RimJ/RimL family protein N-acetyltransferase